MKKRHWVVVVALVIGLATGVYAWGPGHGRMGGGPCDAMGPGFGGHGGGLVPPYPMATSRRFVRAPDGRAPRR